MEHIAALLLVIGCSSNLQECRELPAPVPFFESEQECLVQRAFTLGDYTDAMPYVAATCVYVDPALEEEDAELTWDVRPDGTLVASIDVPQMIASSGVRRDDAAFAE